MSDYTDRQAAALTKLEAATTIVDAFANGAADDTVQTDSGMVPSVAKLAADLGASYMQAGAIYADEATGLAATRDGEFFSVPGADANDYTILYKNAAGVAVEIKRYSSAAALEAYESNATAWTHLTYDQASIVGFVDKTSGSVVGGDPYRSTDWLPVMPDTTYTIQGYTSGNAAHMWYDKSRVLISPFGMDMLDAEVAVTSPSNASYMRCTTKLGSVFLAQSTNPDIDINRLLMVLSQYQPAISADLVDWNSGSVSDALDRIETQQARIATSINANSNILDLISDASAPLFVDTYGFTRSCITGAVFDAVAVISRDSDYALTVETGAGVQFPPGSSFVIEDSATGKFMSYLVKTVINDQITVFEALPASPVNCQPMHDSANGQHLSRFGFTGLADYVAAQLEKYAYKKDDVLFEYHAPIGRCLAYNDPNVYNLAGDTVLLSVTPVGGATAGGVVVGSNDLNKILQASNADENISNMPGSTYLQRRYSCVDSGVGKGFSFQFDVQMRDGFIELPVSGSRHSYTGAADGLTYYTDGQYRVEVIGDNSTILHDQTYATGQVQFLNIPFSGVASIMVRMTLAENVPTYMSLLGCYAYSKSPKTPISPIFGVGDVIAFLGDSWTQYPLQQGAEVRPLRADGSVADGMCFLSERIKATLSSAGVSVTTLNMGKSGMTSAWGAYWVGSILTLNPKPTHCVINFGINDYNSTTFGTDTPYDFDPTNQWSIEVASAGGVVGKTSPDLWFSNLQYICTKLISYGIKPVVMMPPHTAAASQAQGIRNLLLAKIACGFRNDNQLGGGA